MIDRNAEILRNKVEVLQRRKAELLRELADKEAHVASLSPVFDEAARAGRRQAMFPAAPARGVEVGARRGELDRRAQSGPGSGFNYGLIVSLSIGILFVIFAK
jgi:hypothetical protein